MAVEQAVAELDHCGQFGHLESELDHVPPDAIHSGDLADLLTTCRRLKRVQVVEQVDLELELEAEEEHACRQDGGSILVERGVEQD